MLCNPLQCTSTAHIVRSLIDVVIRLYRSIHSVGQIDQPAVQTLRQPYVTRPCYSATRLPARSNFEILSTLDFILRLFFTNFDPNYPPTNESIAAYTKNNLKSVFRLHVLTTNTLKSTDTVSEKKLCQCYFLNNSMKHWPI